MRRSVSRPSRGHLAAFGAALALAASAFGGLVLPRLADPALPASMRTPAARLSPARQKLDDGLCHERHRRAHRPDGAVSGL